MGAANSVGCDQGMADGVRCSGDGRREGVGSAAATMEGKATVTRKFFLTV
jgi:hypothetical protein